MSATGLKVFDSTVQKTNIWLDQIMDDLHWSDRHKAYHALCSVLHTLRDRLPVEETAHLASQLPLLIRGAFYEGWRPAATPVKERRREQFVAHVSDAFILDCTIDPEQICRSVLKVLEKNVDVGAINNLRKILPEQTQEML